MLGIRHTLRNTQRFISTLNIGNITENIYERSDYPIKTCNKILGNQRVGVIGYGPQGRGQALNLKDNGIQVCVGVRKGQSWAKALDDGWEPHVDLFEIEEACDRSTIISYLLSDAAQISLWDNVKKYLKENDTLYFSHGFGITYNEQTNIVPPDNVDVIMVSPKGSGLTVRTHFQNGRGINSSYAIHNNYTGYAKDKCLAMAFAIGSGHVFETTFENETYSDLVGERCVLMGLIKGALNAQYTVLRQRGHSPTEAYNETVEEAFDSLFPLINEQGMEWLYSNCSTTAQRGALDWSKIFEKELIPLIESCYVSVAKGKETKRVIDANSNPDYRINLEDELNDIKKEELWIVGEQLRKLRPSSNDTGNDTGNDKTKSIQFKKNDNWGDDNFLL